MNKEAWDELTQLEEEADNISIGHMTYRKPGEKYVSTRKRLKNPSDKEDEKKEDDK